MSGSAADGPHEFVVAPELAEVAERLGVPCTLATACGSRSPQAKAPTHRAAAG
jgi:hypothetical protein